MIKNPRGVPNVRPGLRYSSTPVDFAQGPNQAASIGHYKNTLTPGPYAGSVPVGTEGPNQAAAIGRYMADQRNREIRSMFGGRFDQIGSHGFGQRPTGGSRRPLSSARTGGFTLRRNPVVEEDPRIRRMTNKAVNAAFINADPRNAMKRFMGRGLSQDQGTLASAIPQISSAYGDAAYASMAQPFFDYLNDQQNALAQQRLRVQQLSPLLSLLR